MSGECTALQPPELDPEQEGAPALARGRLTDEQQHAVARRHGALALSAAAGSGKTSVLVERFVAAVREDGLSPAQILAITFTDRAAAELRERVRARFLELGERAAARDTEAAFVSTFHGFCARLLRSHALQAGVDPDFEILDEGLAGRMRLRAFSRALGEFLSEGGEQAVELAAAYGGDRLRAMIESVHAALRSRGEIAPRLPIPAGGEPAAVRACAQLDQLLAAFTSAYEAAKRTRGALDFDDLELRARDLLVREQGIRARWSERFELLMVDEFQDTNPRQLAILEALARENLFTVGDELQAIYGFRNADVRLFRARNAALAQTGGVLELNANFRAREQVLDVIATIFQERLPTFSAPHAARGAGEFPAAGLQSASPAVELLLVDRSGWGEEAELARELGAGLPRAAPWRQAEARMLAARVAQLVHAGGLAGGQIAVLLRALGDIDVYERALQQAGLRTIASAGAFWGQQQVEDLLAYLRALANPLDELALYGALASPLAGEHVSLDALALLSRAAREHGGRAFECALGDARSGQLEELPAPERLAIVGFCERLAAERAELSRRSISELLERAVASSAYRAHLAAAGGGGERAVANLNKLLRLARRFEAREGRDLRGFLDHVAYLKQSPRGGESEAPVEGAEPDAVRLMSIHAAKGLEFPVVCVADLGRGPNLRMPDLLVDGERIGLSLAALDGSPSAPALDYEELCAERRRDEAEEEDRIAYVAMTRAREMLLLSGSIELERWPEQRHGACAIGWIGPALRADLPSLLLAARQEHRSELMLEVGERPALLRCLIAGPESAELLRSEPPTAPARLPARGDPEEVPPAADEERSAPIVHEQLALAFPVAPEAPPRGPTPAAGSHLPIALSFSSLSELERCGYRYYLERVLRLPEQSGPAVARAGAPRAPSSTHASAARSRTGCSSRSTSRAPEPPGSSACARSRASSACAWVRARREQLAGTIEAALRAEPARRAGAALSVRREHPFAFSLGAQRPLISGVIDLLAIERDGGALVIDYKSNALEPGEDLRALVERDYSLQRELYALAVLLTGAAHVEVVHWFLERPEDHVAARYAARERGSLESLLTERLELIERSGFAVSPRPHRGLCASCPGRSGMCSWGPAETLRELPQGT